MCKIKTEISINVDNQWVWQILSDLSSYSQWNTFFTKISGKLQAGETLQITTAPNNAKPMSFSSLLLDVKQATEIRWLGTLLAKWFFAGEHYMLLKTRQKGQTQFIHGENFTGIFSPIFKWCFLKNTQKGFELFNQQLKQQAEKV